MAAQPRVAPLPLHHSLVGGRPVPGTAGLRDVRSPATGEVFAQTSLLAADQAASAVAAAREAFPGWRALSFRERGKVLQRMREIVVAQGDGLAELIAREQGKPVAEGYVADLFPSLEVLKHLALHAEDLLREEDVEAEVLLQAHKDCRLVYEPFGVVLNITPWNYPFSIPLTGTAAALAAGNTVVVKPAPATTLIALRMAELFQEAGAPAGVVNVVAVDDTVAASLVEDPRVGKILFTGSVATGRKVMAAAARNLTPVLLELGGKDAAIVCRDADLDRAARGVVWGAFMNAGQTCASVERVYVEAPVADDFVAKVVEETRRLRVGDPEGEVEMGPLTLERQRALVAEHVDEAVGQGARALTGGAAPAGPGWFYPPTVLTGVTQDMRIMREETFGPVLPIMAVESLDEAIRLANDSAYGLTASGWTRSADTGRRLQRELHAGVVTINDCLSSYGEPTAPWGGVKHSGIGRTHGRSGLREMVQVKYVTLDHSRRPLLWWFPYGSELRRLMPVALAALHGRFAARIPAQLRLLGFPRFWKRVSAWSVFKNIDRLLT
ncbi:MAG TPA: aldehyde dehydrogenase family protein [Vicinamibacteria bacterium]|jgi:succinate-semialdehyde dehydrogenase/glutarate-semialdehyde dehydrogenase